jgi:hypothetical protein
VLKPTKCAPERGADLHQLEARLDLLDQHVDLDRADVRPRCSLERGEQSFQSAASSAVWIFGR